jgi:hypothetical protein
MTTIKIPQPRLGIVYLGVGRLKPLFKFTDPSSFLNFVLTGFKSDFFDEYEEYQFRKYKT